MGQETDMRTTGSGAPVWRTTAIVLALLWTLTPLYWIVRLAFETNSELATYPPWAFPPHPQPGAFLNILGYEYHTAAGIDLKPSGQAGQIILGLRNSLILAMLVTTVTMLVVVPLAYVFARLNFPHRGKLLAAILLAVSLPPVSTLIPFYTLYVQLDLVGTLSGLLIVTLTITIPIITWMLLGFFRNLPPVESLGRIDGLSRSFIFLRIFVPMARGGIGVAALIAFLFSWNEYVYAQVLVTGSDAVTLPAAMTGFLFQDAQPTHLAASLTLTLVPPVILAYFLQRHISELNIVDPVR
jgi:multiple sugar transport system permease protein